MMAGLGTAIAPDLTKMATYGSPRSLVATMHMSMTEYVRRVSAKGTASFPGIVKGEQGGEREIWDLSQMPPVLRKFTTDQSVTLERDQKWKHPPASAGYTPQELADIIGFLRWAATGSQKEVPVSEVEPLP